MRNGEAGHPGEPSAGSRAVTPAPGAGERPATTAEASGPPWSSPRAIGDAEQARTFLAGAGRVFQATGALCLLSTCLIGSFAGLVRSDEIRIPIETFADFFRAEHCERALGSFDVLAAVAAGLGLLTTGLGLEGRKRRSGKGAMIVSGVFAIVWFSSAAGFLAMGEAWVKAIIACLLGLFGVGLFLLAAHAAALLKDHAAAPSESEATPEFLAGLKRRKEAD